MCAVGVRASAIHSLMPHDLVRAELTRFRRGDLDVLFNVEVGGHKPVAVHASQCALCTACIAWNVWLRHCITVTAAWILMDACSQATSQSHESPLLSGAGADRGI
jgi:NAD-dependent dihydropyrimidine dehydrogenase PreA subunit